jgi:DNA-binding NtrC family response regulator
LNAVGLPPALGRRLKRGQGMTSDIILCVDDEPYILDALKRVFFDKQVVVLTATSANEALQLLSEHEVKVVITDECMPCMSGAELLELVRLHYPDTIRIMLTGHASLTAAIAAINKGEIYRFFLKPWDDSELEFAVQAALEKYNLEAENRRLLAIIRRQALDLKLLERQFPGIADLDRDEQGRIIVSEITQEELERIIRECEEKFR